MSIERVATLFGVHRRTVEKWFACGLERVRLGGKVYTTRNALQRFAKYSGPDSADAEVSRQQNERDARELEVRYGIKNGLTSNGVSSGYNSAEVQVGAR